MPKTQCHIAYTCMCKYSMCHDASFFAWPLWGLLEKAACNDQCNASHEHKGSVLKTSRTPQTSNYIKKLGICFRATHPHSCTLVVDSPIDLWVHWWNPIVLDLWDVHDFHWDRTSPNLVFSKTSFQKFFFPRTSFYLLNHSFSESSSVAGRGFVHSWTISISSLEGDV